MRVDDRDQIARRSRTALSGAAHDDLVVLSVLADDLHADLSPGVHPQCRKLAHPAGSVAKAGAVGKGWAQSGAMGLKPC
jgi:hypothetical protein